MKKIKTIHITPTKEMPLEFFKECYRISYFMELMERTPDGWVIWDETVTSIYSPETAEVVYSMIQDDIIEVNLEVPIEFLEKALDSPVGNE